MVLLCAEAWGKPREHANRPATATKAENPRQRQATAPTAARTAEPFPFQFEENRGQANSEVRFISRDAGYTLFLTASEAVMVFEPVSPANGHVAKDPRTIRSVKRPANVTPAIVKMKLSGSKASPQSGGVAPLTGTTNYFIGDASRWRTGIPTYSAVKYSDIYPGIDLLYYGNHRRLEYDFVLNPGADAKNIALTFDGITNLAIDSAGDLTMESQAGKLRLRKPSVFQMIGGNKKAVRAGYILRPNHSVGFAVGNYDPTRTLVIDPVLVYSSFLGGSGWDAATAIALDAAGNEYVAGFTISPDFPSTSGSISAAPNGACVGFVRKFDPTRTTVLYSSYLGGTNGVNNCLFGDGINSIAVDSSGQAYTTGEASSTDFPTTVNAFQSSLGTGAASNAFLAKFAADGQSLLYSTYLGGTGSGHDGYGDDGYAAIADDSGNAYIVGQAATTDFPLTTSTTFRTFQSGPYPKGNGFLTQIDTTQSGASSLIYSTVLGGETGDDAITGIAMGASHNFYVTGWTSSTDLPVTDTAFQTSNGAQAYCGFVSQIDISKTGPSSVIYSSYFCGTNDDWGWGIAADASQNVYVTGEAFSSDFPTTLGQTNSENGKGFAAKFDLTAVGPASLLYARFLGGDNSSFGDWPYRIAVDSNTNAYIVGQTSSQDLPVTSDAVQSSLLSATTGDGFLQVLSPDASTVLYGTYLGGSGTAAVGILGDFVYDLALDSSFNIYMVGQTFSSDFPTTATALQGTYGGSGDAFLTILSALDVPRIAGVVPPSGAAGSVVTIHGSGFGTVTGLVKIAGIPALIESWHPDSIVVQIPASLASGPIQVAVTTSRETSNSGQFSVENLFISRLSRTAGPEGSSIIIYGSGFGKWQKSNRVTFNGVSATVMHWTESSIAVRVPEDATTGSVIVTVGGAASNAVHFNVAHPDRDRGCRRAEQRCCGRDCD